MRLFSQLFSRPIDYMNNVIKFHLMCIRVLFSLLPLSFYHSSTILILLTNYSQNCFLHKNSSLRGTCIPENLSRHFSYKIKNSEFLEKTKTFHCLYHFFLYKNNYCTINSKINGTPKGFLLANFEATLYLSRSEFTCT